MALYYEPGKVDPSNVYPADGKNFTLDELQDFVGGYIECVTLPGNRVMVINEEGKFNPAFEPNERATGLLHEAGGDPHDYVVGNALVMWAKELN